MPPGMRLKSAASSASTCTATAKQTTSITVASSQPTKRSAKQSSCACCSLLTPRARHHARGRRRAMPPPSSSPQPTRKRGASWEPPNSSRRMCNIIQITAPQNTFNSDFTRLESLQITFVFFISVPFCAFCIDGVCPIGRHASFRFHGLCDVCVLAGGEGQRQCRTRTRTCTRRRLYVRFPDPPTTACADSIFSPPPPFLPARWQGR